MKKERVIFYRDESDEVFHSGVKTKKIDKHFDYERKGLWDRFLRQVFVRFIVMPFAKFWTRVGFRSRFVNRKILKKHKGGCFIYSNHTQAIPDAFRAAAAPLPHMSYIIVHPDNVSFPGLEGLMMALGTIPIPTEQNGMVAFLRTVEKHAEKHPVVVFPERVIWPYYTKIRPFTDVSFRYPVRCGVPVFVMTTTFHKCRFSSKPREIVYIDGPFYPDENLGKKESQEDLRRRVYQTMCERAKLNTYEYYRYEKLPEEASEETKTSEAMQKE